MAFQYTGGLLTKITDFPVPGNSLDLPARSVTYQYDANSTGPYQVPTIALTEPATPIAPTLILPPPSGDRTTFVVRKQVTINWEGIDPNIEAMGIHADPATDQCWNNVQCCHCKIKPIVTAPATYPRHGQFRESQPRGHNFRH
jgi:hypothetical protein